jgi:hypothetical protein
MDRLQHQLQLLVCNCHWIGKIYRDRILIQCRIIKPFVCFANFGELESHPSPRVRRKLGVGYKASAGAAAIGRRSFKVVGGLIDPLLAFLFRLLKSG